VKLQPGQHIHIVGIGGSGLSAIAHILLGQGYHISGSDRSLNPLTEALSQQGAVIHGHHAPEHVQGSDAVIITSAVTDDHVEVIAAREQGIPVYKRQEIMADVMVGKWVIAVAGTKGKTTTTALIVHLLQTCGLDPSYIVGGVLGNTGTNAGVGQGQHFVVEADEYDHMFLGLCPNIAVLTNIEWDHPDCFPTEQAMLTAFQHFVNLLRQTNGLLIACQDDPAVKALAEHHDAIRVRTYGIHQPADICATTIASHTDGTTHFVIQAAAAQLSVISVLPGSHNVQNALAAYAVAEALALPHDGFQQALQTFRLTARRFDVRADHHGIAIVDDYAHNPMSIKAVLAAARHRYPGRTLWAIWQPHTYSRTQALFSSFVSAFAAADHVLITDIYAAREQPIVGVSSAAVVAAMDHADARLASTFADVLEILRAEVTAPAVLIIMSAGDAPQIGIDFLAHLQERV
jgi:UDP-N-acetylmuramate--alanine ligase